MGLGLADQDAHSVLRMMLVLKIGCQNWVEDYGGDISGFVYRKVKDGLMTADLAAKKFCDEQTNQCSSDKTRRRDIERKKEQERIKQRRALEKHEAGARPS